MRVNNKRKSAISVKTFIAEFGETFSEHMKERLMELEIRCFLTRKDIDCRFDLKHVEHLQFKCNYDLKDPKAPHTKEYAYGQFVVIDGGLYFSESCLENNEVMQSNMVSTIYNALVSDNIIFDEGTNLKKVDDSNIDFVVDSILSSCPQVSQSYLDIVHGMISRANNR